VIAPRQCCGEVHLTSRYVITDGATSEISADDGFVICGESSVLTDDDAAPWPTLLACVEVPNDDFNIWIGK
jgi:hypothetical protein